MALASGVASAGDETAFEAHAQATYALQYKPSFPATYSGQNSLRPEQEQAYSFTSTVFLGARFRDTELYFDPELIVGQPFSGLHGLGGFTNGEDQRGSNGELSAYRARAFVRQTWNLGGERKEQASQQNQVSTSYSSERVVLTAGNVSVLDVFDAVDYSHDPRTQFMNWSSLTYGAWDYPADARGYTWGAALEYISADWQVRAGRFLVPVQSNGLELDRAWMHRYGDVAELEIPFDVSGHGGTWRALVFRNHVNAGAYEDALATSSPPDVSLVRRTQSKHGFGLGTQLDLTPEVGAYVRAGWSDGRTETFMFTEIDRSIAAGTLVKGAGWSRPQDQLGVAAYLNGLSGPHRDYLAAGGSGFFLGDGRLSYATERIVETFYSLGMAKFFAVSVGYQRIVNPAYNHDRGPADVFGFRLHAEI